MKRATAWALGIVAAAALSAGVGSALIDRQSKGAGLPTGTAPVTLELAPTDVARASRAELVSALAISGSLKAVNSAVVKAKVAAEVREINVREGDRVQAGQLLGRLDDTEFKWRLQQAEDQAASARAQLDIAERTLDNNRALVNQGFISKNALDTSVSSAAGARASLQAALAAAELARKSVRDTEIRAPLAGLVAQRLVQPGERVPVDGRMLEVVDLSRIELEAAIAPEDVVTITIGQPARLQIDGLAQPVPARVARINPSTQAGTRAVMAYLEVEPLPGLRQGLFARGSIEMQRRTSLVVPMSAMRFDQALPHVLALQDGRVVQRSVRLGVRGEVMLGGVAESAVEVLEGLADGEPVLRGTVGAVKPGVAARLAGGAASAAAAAR